MLFIFNARRRRLHHKLSQAVPKSAIKCTSHPPITASPAAQKEPNLHQCTAKLPRKSRCVHPPRDDTPVEEAAPTPPPPLSKAQYKSLLLCTAGYRFYSAHVAPLAFSDSSFSSSCHRFFVLVVPLPFVVVSTVAAFCRHKSESS